MQTLPKIYEKHSLFIILLITIVLFSLTSCADSKTINGKTYRPYGLFNQESAKNDSVYYEVSGWAVFSGVVFMEALFIPTIYTFGFNLWEPVCLKSEIDHDPNKGVVR